MSRVYALYKGENLITIGTAEEIAKERGIKKDTVYFLASPANKKRAETIRGKRAYNGTGTQVCVALDEEDEE